MSDIDINQVLSQLRTMATPAQGSSANSAPAAGGADFSSMLKSAFDQVNETQQQAGKLADAFEKGDGSVDLTDVIVSLQKARGTFHAKGVVRNKLVTAYQDVMNMSI